MLILSRKKNEIVMLGDDIQIVIVEIRGDKVRLGIQAPQELPVHRREVWQRIRDEGKAAQMFDRELPQLSESTELALLDEEDMRLSQRERERFEVHPQTLGNYRMAFFNAARRFLHQKRCMEYWAESNYGGMSKAREEGRLRELKVTLDMARDRLCWAIEQVKNIKGSCDANQ